MTPTTKLRFVKRIMPYTGIVGERHILQQWWANEINLGFGSIELGNPTGEWRDVPIEEAEIDRRKAEGEGTQTIDKQGA